MIMRITLAAALALAAAPALAAVAPPAAVVTDGAPPVSDALAQATRPYLEFRHANFLGWNAADHSMMVKTRFGDTEQLHVVGRPGGQRSQVSFEAEPILTGALSPTGAGLVIQKDKGGDEFYQLYLLKEGRLTLLTDGKSRNWFGAWSHDGKLIGYTSTRRNGADADLYVTDPAKPGSERMVAQVTGGGWSIADFARDGRTALVVNRLSISQAVIYELDLASGALRAITKPAEQVFYEGARYAPDGTIWVASDKGSDVLRLGRLDRKSGAFTPATSETWEVSDFAIAPDGSFAAYAINEAGVSRVRILDLATGAVRRVDGLPAGVIPYAIGSAIQIAPWGEIGLSMSSAKVPGDAFSVDPKTLAVTRWTRSESGGLDPSQNVEPRLVEIKSFDGEKVSGFLYLPDPKKFAGRRPLLLDIHGGPEGQTRPEFLGGANYLVNELGVAMFYPNVRGSTGYGKRFVNLDNGPDRRENSVKDVGAFLDALANEPSLDPSRFGVTGLSYGGYMCYATAVHYSARLKGANCYVAISNFVTFLENTQSYRRDLRRVEYGDERDPAQRAKLQAISPLTHVDQIRVPLLVATGGNDPRVPPSEAEQIVSAVRKGGGTAWHVLAKNEGHVFRKKENVDYYFWVGLEFWKRVLLGEAK